MAPLSAPTPASAPPLFPLPWGAATASVANTVRVPNVFTLRWVAPRVVNLFGAPTLEHVAGPPRRPSIGLTCVLLDGRIGILTSQGGQGHNRNA